MHPQNAPALLNVALQGGKPGGGETAAVVVEHRCRIAAGLKGGEAVKAVSAVELHPRDGAEKGCKPAPGFQRGMYDTGGDEQYLCHGRIVSSIRRKKK